MGFSRQEYWSGLPFPSPGDLPDPGIEPWSPILEADALTSGPQFFIFTFHFHTLEKEILAWRIPGSGSLMGCCLWGRTELDTTEAI